MSTSVAEWLPTEDIWLIGTHAGDREIHVEPYFESHKFTRFLSDPLGRDISTRRILTADDLNRIRNISPMAVAIQILLSTLRIRHGTFWPRVGESNRSRL
jgi:hypothetical protein